MNTLNQTIKSQNPCHIYEHQFQTRNKTGTKSYKFHKRNTFDNIGFSQATTCDENFSSALH